MDDQRLSKLPAGAIGAVLGAAFVTKLAALDARSLAAGMFCCSAGWVCLVSVCLGRITPGAATWVGCAATMRGLGAGTARAVVIAPVASLGDAAARALVGA